MIKAEEKQMSEREELMKKAKELGFTEEKGFRILSPEEHRKLVKGKKIILSKQAKEDLKRLSGISWKDAKKENKILEDWIKRNMGRRTKEFEKGCIHCKAWKMCDFLKYKKEDFN